MHVGPKWSKVTGLHDIVLRLDTIVHWCHVCGCTGGQHWCHVCGCTGGQHWCQVCDCTGGQIHWSMYHLNIHWWLSFSDTLLGRISKHITRVSCVNLPTLVLAGSQLSTAVSNWNRNNQNCYLNYTSNASIYIFQISDRYFIQVIWSDMTVQRP